MAAPEALSDRSSAIPNALVLRGARSFLAPWNRKLQQLHGISLRNLTADKWSSRRPHTRTIDDAGLPNGLQSPAKAVALRESRELVHSRSSENLRIPTKSERPRTDNGQDSSGSPRRPRKPRRSSTMDFGGSDAKERIARFQSAITQHCLQVFFSIHVEGVDDPVYISEIRQNSMNPDFKFFDLQYLDAVLRRQAYLTVKIWIRRDSPNQSSGSSNTSDFGNDSERINAASAQGWRYHILCNVNLGAIQFLGKTIETFSQPLPENTILFHLSDGVYTSFTDYDRGSDLAYRSLISANATANAERTSSYEALMRLCTLDDTVRDAYVTRRKLYTSIDEMVKNDKDRVLAASFLGMQNRKRNAVMAALERQKESTDRARQKLLATRDGLQSRRQNIREGREAQRLMQAEVKAGKDVLQQSRAAYHTTAEQILGQRRRICEDLQVVYPVDPIPGHSLAFTIRGLYLPNSVFTGVDIHEEVISAAVGHVAHLVYLMSFYLGVSLPYPIQVFSSTSQIIDPISLMAGSRSFVLQLGSRGISYRFDYAVFLLNKNIEVLATKLGLKILDTRQTLPNLKFVLLVATSGKGDLPTRKIGGVRGLLKGVLRNSGQTSRRGSTDSSIGYKRPPT